MSTTKENHASTPFLGKPNVRRALLVLLAIITLSPVVSMAQRATLTDDSQTSTSNPNQNFGSKVTFQVSGTTLKGFLKFKLTPNLPTGTTGNRIEKATVKLFVTTVNTAGTVDIYRVAAAWDEGNITNNTAPALGTLLTSLSLDATSEDRWVTIDITQLVRDWLDSVLPNNGVALLAAPGGVNVTFNSKENGTTSHEPLLEILLNHVATADHATSADSATTAGTAAVANALSGSATVNGNQIIGPLTNATLAASSLTGVVPIANGGTGSATQNFVDLSTNQTVAGNKTFSGPLNTGTHYSIGGFRILSNGGGSNLFAGIAAGDSNTTGGSNAFVGSDAGHDNTSGSGNSFFGTGAGQANTSGNNNAFFGSFAGQTNTTASHNSFFGQGAGQFNTTGDLNAFFGSSAGHNNSTGLSNSIFGTFSGLANTTGSNNVFFGLGAGSVNTTGSGNTFVGQSAGNSNTVENSNTFIGAQANGVAGISNATALGANAVVTQSDTMVLGTSSVTVQVPGNLSVANSFSANGSNLTNLNANNISTGTLDNSRLGVVPITNGGTGSSTQNFVDVANDQTVSGNKTFNNNVTVGNSSSGGSLTLTNTTNRFLELGSNLGFDSVSGTVVGLRLKSTHPLENFSYGIFHGSNVFPGALIFRKDDESISPGDARNRLIIAGNGDVLVNPGNIGIGTTSPSRKLHVVGGVQIDGPNPGGNMLNMFNADAGERTFASWNYPGLQWIAGLEPTGPDTVFRIRRNGGPNAISVNNSNNFIGLGIAATPNFPLDVAGNANFGNDVYAQGNVGIGTTAPAKKLDVNSGVNGGIQVSGFDATELRIANSRSGDLNSPSRVVLQDNNSATQWSIENINNGQDFRIFEFPELITPFFIKRTTGNVGIGTTNPGFRLDVNGVINATEIYRNGMPFSGGQWSVSGNDIYYDAGNVGIGTTSPGFNLDVVGQGNFSDTLQIGSHLNVGGNVFVRNSFPQVNLQDGMGGDLATFNSTTGPGSTATVGSVPGTAFVIRSGGQDSIYINPNTQNVGIGTVSPSERLEVGGNLRINGDFVATGTKSAVVTLPDKREVALYAVESPGNWFEDFGSAALVNGAVTVLLDPLFAQTINTEITYHVFLTANGNCRGLYVAQKTPTGFEVRELEGGASNITFDYRIVARRRGYENVVSRPR